MSTDVIVGSTKNPRALALDRDLAMTLAPTEYERVVAVFEGLTPDQWAQPTDCPGWDVRAMAGHMLGMIQMSASVLETARQQRAASKRGGVPIDALTALQVAKNAHLSIDELVQETRTLSRKAARARRRTPAFIRNRRLPQPQDAGDGDEWWTIGYLSDIIMTRDPFLHRIDISRATGTTLRLTADHEGVLVDDIVREWAERHGQPYRLELTGPAGGSWSYDAGGGATGQATGDGAGEQITMDAVEFLRAISGRGPSNGLLATKVPV